MQMNVEIEKSLALMQEVDGLEWFSTGTGDDVRIWEGTKEDAEAKWDDYCHECDNEEKEPNTFEQWVEDEYDDKQVDVEEYDERTSDWLVYTDSEADDAWDESLENYIDECLEIPQSMRNYFDRESWKSDARMDGRGHCLSGHNGHEEEQQVNGTTYYLYRQN
jgi:hypothetical protein